MGTSVSLKRTTGEGDTAFIARTYPSGGPRFYIRYPRSRAADAGLDDPVASSLFDHANRRAEPYANAALSRCVESKLATIADWIRHHPLLAEGTTPPSQVEAALSLIQNSAVISHCLFAVDALVGPRKDLKAHNPEHTWDTLKYAVLFALAEGHSPRQGMLVAIGATFHDLGYLLRMSDNEPIGARLAVSAMEDFNSFARASGAERYTDEEIRAVRGMILDTYVERLENGQLIRTTPRSELSKCLHDADLSGLGRSDFLERAAEHYAELRSQDQVSPLLKVMQTADGLQYTVAVCNFMGSFMYSTHSAQRLLGPTKDANREMLLCWLIPGGGAGI